MNVISKNQELSALFEELKSKGYSLDLTRGRPSQEQLDLSNELQASKHNFSDFEGVDIRNYGGILGLEGCRALGSKIMGCNKELVIAGGNSSLSLMATYISSLMYSQDEEKWPADVSFICPVPGYDRHFKLCEHFGINMIPVTLTGEGPDLLEVEELVLNNKTIRGIWCVPKHSNPSGETYSLDIINGLLKIFSSAEPGSKIFWDNAYSVHDFLPSPQLEDIFQLAENSSTSNLVVSFGSTSKITFAGGGIGFIAMTKENQNKFIPHYQATLISPDKINQARHIEFFSKKSLEEHMRDHGDLLRPKFQLISDMLSKQPFGTWTRPTGGYFVLFKTKKGLSKRVVSIANELGLKLTPAGSTHPFGLDPNEEFIRIAPTVCSLEEIKVAMEIFSCAVGIAHSE